MSLVDKYSNGDSNSPHILQTLSYREFSALNKTRQTAHVQLLSFHLQHTLFDQRDLNRFVDWIRRETPKPSRHLKSIAKDLADETDVAMLISDPNIGKTLTSLFWFGAKREVRKIIKDILRDGDLKVLMANPDIHNLVHLASLAKLRSQLVSFGSRLICTKDISILRSNKSFNAFLGEMTYAGVHGLSDVLDADWAQVDPPSVTQPNEKLSANIPNTGHHKSILPRRCSNRPDSYMQPSFRPLNTETFKANLNRNLGD